LIIPVFNGANYLSEAIESALAQTYENKEIIVVDDGSTDNGATASIAQSYGEKLIFIQRQNGGVGAALNTAIDAMTGEYFSWLSHDDLYAPTKLESNINAILQIGDGTNRTIIYSNYSVFSDTPETVSNVDVGGAEPETFRFWLTTNNSLHGCTLLVPRKALLEAGGFNENLRTTQDYDLWFRLAKNYHFHHLPQVLVYSRRHEKQGSITMSSLAYDEGNKLLLDFLYNLNSEELKHSTNATEFTAYSRIAISFWQRGFSSAARKATRLAVSKRNQASLFHQCFLLGKIYLGIPEMYCRHFLRRIFPTKTRKKLRSVAYTITKYTRRKTLSKNNLRAKFTRIYEENLFGGNSSKSGAGSNREQTKIIREKIPLLLEGIGARSLLDAPCGDWHWMCNTDLGVKNYIGVDIVREIVDINKKRYGNQKTHFECMNLIDDEIPTCDVILSRDYLVHLSHENAIKALRNFKQSGAKYLLATTFTNHKQNHELVGKNAFWRPLNLEKPPYNFPPAIALINEQCTEDGNIYSDKCLGLWKFSDINLRKTAKYPN